LKRFSVLLLGALLLLGGCVYESEVVTWPIDLGVKRCFQREYAGEYRFTILVQRRMPKGIGRFPDGGTPLDLAAHLVVERQGDPNPTEVGRAEIALFRPGDFGNFERAELNCEEPNRLLFRVENGYLNDRKVTTGEILVPPSP